MIHSGLFFKLFTYVIYVVWASLVSFVGCHYNIQFYFELCTYCNILDIYLSWNMNSVKCLLFYMKLLNHLFCNMFGSVLECYGLTGVSLLWTRRVLVNTHPSRQPNTSARKTWYPDSEPLLRSPKPGITSQPQPASQLNIGTQLTSRGQTWHQAPVVACSLNFTSYNLKYITDHSTEQQYFQH